VAIDSNQKRASALGAGIVFTLCVIPDGALAQADRQTIAHYYGGILAAEPVIITPDCFIGFQGPIEVSCGFQGAINDKDGFNGKIEDKCGFQGVIDGSDMGFQGAIDDSPVGGNGIITDKQGFKGVICDC
jgi:hypothetical protein